ncbi:hypothetical protein BRADI_3g09915v3 [Brachypodium distachyon]|uniref:Uncharacterized protein n=1 Tax=Brachypodium distachyon TaxID=15368 RepID=A0A2K2CWA2_BRADI|nr:hypothetical protein BRADI_3g09915v3 [Brachypodium distachyon]
MGREGGRAREPARGRAIELARKMESSPGWRCLLWTRKITRRGCEHGEKLRWECVGTRRVEAEETRREFDPATAITRLRSRGDAGDGNKWRSTGLAHNKTVRRRPRSPPRGLGSAWGCRLIYRAAPAQF